MYKILYSKLIIVQSGKFGFKNQFEQLAYTVSLNDKYIYICISYICKH